MEAASWAGTIPAGRNYNASPLASDHGEDRFDREVRAADALAPPLQEVAIIVQES